VVTPTVADRCQRSSASKWETRIAVVEAQVRMEQRQTDAAKLVAEQAKAERDSIVANIKERAPRIVERIVQVQAETPEHLRDEPAIIQRDSIITDLRIVVSDWEAAYAAQQRALLAIESALVNVEASRDSLMAVVSARPKGRPWFLPRMGVGPFAGICAGGTPCAGPVAVSITWEIRL
jgi:hypothetical protein